MELALRTSNPLITTLYDRASSECPPEYADNELQAAAWIAKRMLELSELDRKQNQTVQVLLANWVFNGDLGQLWQEHPNQYQTFRDFLNDVGTEREGNRLSPSVISDMVAISEVIVPYCEDNGIEIDGYITGELWAKFRETVPALRKAAEDDDMDKINEVLEAVRTASSRDVLRLTYRRSRGEKYAKGDTVTHNGVSVIALVVPTAKLVEAKAALGRITEWQTIMNGEFRPDVADIRILTTLESDNE